MKRALISVFDKEGIVEFSLELSKLGWEIISTGGTYVGKNSFIAAGAVVVKNINKPGVYVGNLERRIK